MNVVSVGADAFRVFRFLIRICNVYTDMQITDTPQMQDLISAPPERELLRFAHAATCCFFNK